MVFYFEKTSSKVKVLRKLLRHNPLRKGETKTLVES